MSNLKEVALSHQDAEFLVLYRACPPKAQAIVQQTMSYLASTRLAVLRQQMLEAGMTQQADGTWKEPS